MLTRALTVLYIMLCFAIGLLLVFAPWLASWTSNFFAHHYLWVDGLVRNDYLRGCVSGIGLANIGVGAYEARRFTPFAYSRNLPNSSEPPTQVPR